MEAKWLAVMMVGLALAVAIIVTGTNYTDSEQMKACVSSGQEWVHVKGEVYECRQPE
jgi:hypothetical protein